MDDEDAGLVFTAATVYSTLLTELIVELVKGGALAPEKAADVVVRAESVIRHLDVPERDRLIHQMAIDEVRENLEERLALQPEFFALRQRMKSSPEYEAD